MATKGKVQRVSCSTGVVSNVHVVILIPGIYMYIGVQESREIRVCGGVLADMHICTFSS